MNQAEINEASTADLNDKLAELTTTYSDLRMANAISPLENPIQLRMHRRSIARIETELTKRDVQ